jgi:hypothetical protein
MLLRELSAFPQLHDIAWKYKGGQGEIYQLWSKLLRNLLELLYGYSFALDMFCSMASMFATIKFLLAVL